MRNSAPGEDFERDEGTPRRGRLAPQRHGVRRHSAPPAVRRSRFAGTRCHAQRTNQKPPTHARWRRSIKRQGILYKERRSVCGFHVRVFAPHLIESKRCTRAHRQYLQVNSSCNALCRAVAVECVLRRLYTAADDASAWSRTPSRRAAAAATAAAAI